MLVFLKLYMPVRIHLYGEFDLHRLQVELLRLSHSPHLPPPAVP